MTAERNLCNLCLQYAAHQDQPFRVCESVTLAILLLALCGMNRVTSRSSTGQWEVEA